MISGFVRWLLQIDCCCCCYQEIVAMRACSCVETSEQFLNHSCASRCCLKGVLEKMQGYGNVLDGGYNRYPVVRRQKMTQITI